MQTIIIGGLPGANKKNTIFAIGKTMASETNKVAIVLTETDDDGLKNAIIDHPGIHAAEMISSCVPCSFQFDLINEMQKIIDLPDIKYIIIELPFSSMPHDVKEALENMEFADMTFAPLVHAIDAEQMEAGVDKIPKLINTQIANSQILSINTDIVSTDKISAINKTLQEINPSAQIVEFSLKSPDQGFEGLVVSLSK